MLRVFVESCPFIVFTLDASAQSLAPHIGIVKLLVAVLKFATSYR